MDSSACHLMQRVFLGILELALAGPMLEVGSEVAPQYDHDQESHHSVAQLRVSEDMIREATRCTDDMHVVMADYCWRASVAHGSTDGGFSMDDFHTLRERVSMMRTDY